MISDRAQVTSRDVLEYLSTKKVEGQVCRGGGINKRVLLSLKCFLKNFLFGIINKPLKEFMADNYAVLVRAQGDLHIMDHLK